MIGGPATFRRDPGVKLSDQVAAELEQRILGGAYAPGDRLPTEPELCVWLGVSRTVVRDALRTLASIGLVTIRQGIGIVVAQPSDAPITHALAIRLQNSDLTIGDVLAARTGLESALAAEAAQTGTAEDWRALWAVFERFESTVREGEWGGAQEGHLRFHQGILRALHLSALELMLQPLQEIIMISSLPPELDNGSFWDVDAHRAILEALEEGSPPAARRAMLEHFELTKGPDYGNFRTMLFRDARNLPSYKALAMRIRQ
jgi:GntR family transcriptional regulator, transcriptional repressor for pyruvate dehydrogenase complex